MQPDSLVVPLAIGLMAATVLPAATPISVDAIYMGIPINKFPEFPITLLDKDFYVVGYSEDFENPAWVFYRVGPAEDLTAHKRPKFRLDKETEARVKHGDYTNTGFDRGHMAPNHALGSRFGGVGAKSTFVMTNVCPQFHKFNDGQWGDLEEWIGGRKKGGNDFSKFVVGWADHYEEVWVVVGPIFDEERGLDAIEREIAREEGPSRTTSL